jgi:DNA processing protein
MYPDLIFLISLTRVPQVGCIHARTLLQHFGSADAVFKAPLSSLEKLEGIGKIRARSIKSFRDFQTSEKEIKFLERYNIRALHMQHEDYPRRLLPAYDAPVILYYKGNADLNHKRIVSIVGTRHYTDYGKQITEKIVRELAVYDTLVVSGLAFGIDAIAHKTAIRNSLFTVAVLAHGLTSLYPSEHRSLSKEMLKQGGLITEFISTAKPDKHNFPIRNRIVAGMSDCTIVTETAVKGGSMITADLANGYFKEVFAVPGRLNDFKSAGCNWLIRNHQAAMLENIHDLAGMMGWDLRKTAIPDNPAVLSTPLNEVEQKIVAILKERQTVHIDTLNAVSGFPNSTNAGALLELEMKDLIFSMPGRIYRLKEQL